MKKIAFLIRVLIATLAMVFTMAFQPFSDLPKSVQKKLDKQLNLIFPDFTLEKIELKLQDSLKTEQENLAIDNIYEIVNNEHSIAFIVLAHAPGKFDNFDFAIIYNKEFSIKNVQILEYREDQGGEIGSKRWLKQFEGKTNQDAITLNDDIQGISGATISCISTTDGVRKITYFINKVYKK